MAEDMAERREYMAEDMAEDKNKIKIYGGKERGYDG